MLKSRLVDHLALGCLISFVVVTAVFGTVYGAIEYLGDPSDGTAVPLSEAVREDLCEKLSLPSDDPRCSPEATVSASDYFDELELLVERMASRQQVDQLLGEYVLYCDDPVPWQGGHYYRCFYTFDVDGQDQIVVLYRDDGVLYSINGTTGRND